MRKPREAALCCVLLSLAGCREPKHPAIEDLSGREDLSIFKVSAVRGTRDGDRLDAQALVTDSSSMLTMDMRFAIGAPTHLKTGVWRWARKGATHAGNVVERSVTFLGGQSGPPSIGGTFDLTENGQARYLVTLPTTELKTKLESAPDWLRSNPEPKP